MDGLCKQDQTSGLHSIPEVDKIKSISNTTVADSINVEVAADGDNMIITCRNVIQLVKEPVIRTSTDNGATFEPMLRLATNGTIREIAE